jgi:LacI family transcriptional regulator
MSNIREIAERSGVSVATVSRVLNGFTGVSDETRKKVLAAAEELDYAPSAAARALVTRRSLLIGVVLLTGDQPEFQHPYFQVVLDGVKNALDREGYDLLLLGGDVESSGEDTYVERSRRHRVDGVILMGAGFDNPEVERLVGLGLPTVAVDLELQGKRAGFVSSDNVEGARLAVRHLHECGCRRVATITGMSHTSPGVERLRGYELEIKKLKLPKQAELVRAGDFYVETGHRGMKELLALAEPPDGVFAASDLSALGAMRAIQEQGLRVPEDVAVVGFDDIQFAALASPPLTTIRQNKVAIGSEAVRALLAMLEDPPAPPPAIRVPVELVVRGSSCRAPRSAAG